LSILENIPESWATTVIGQINEYKSSSINPAGFPEEVFELYSVPSFPSGKPEFVKGEDIGSTKQYVEPGDVLLCKINPRINRVWRVALKGKHRQIASSEWIVVHQKLFQPDFLRYFFTVYSFRDLLCSDVSGVGGSLTRAQPAKVNQYEIPVAPIAEQKEIASRLDNLLAQVDSIKARLERISVIIKRFRKSVLDTFCSGKHNSECIEGELEEFCEIISGSAFKSNCFTKKGIPVVKISNIQYGKFENDPNQEYLPLSYLKDYKKFIVKYKDVLLALTRPITNNTLKVCLYPNFKELALLNQRVALLKPYNSILKEFLILLVQSDFFKESVKKNLSETLQPNLSPKDLAKIIIKCPNIQKQNEILNNVKILLVLADHIEQHKIKAQSHVNILTQSILSKAFSGELTSEWREQHPELISGENSAEELLKRIKQEKNSVQNNKKIRKPTKQLKA
jgi:type I restriction enzyme S subunit